MPIPFPPNGPQVQAALQKVPTPQLQQYAAGRPPQPTGQVTPGPMGAAAEALNARGAMGAANQRQQAMNNNPANSPTIFQQKDMELQQKAQQLAAMGQQIQQKEQQLGVLGALMAKKAQDMQARESMGVAALPMRPDMFTAMDGGIVFSGGGAVQRFNGLQGSQPRNRAEANLEDLLAQIELLPDRENILASGAFGSQPDAYILRRKLQERGYTVDPKTNKIKQLEEKGGISGTGARPLTKEERATTEFIQEQMQANPSFFRTFLENRMGAPAPQQSDTGSEDKSKGAPSAAKSTVTSGRPSGVASLGTRPSIESSMERLDPFLSRSPQEENYSRLYLEEMQKIADAYRRGVLTEEQAKKMMDARKAEMAAQYGKYTKDRDTRQEELIGAMKGEAPTFQERLGAGLKRLPVDLKGVRLGGLFGALGAGAAESDAEYKKREREANIKRAEIRELNAKADLLEERGQMAEADRVRKEAEARKKDEAGLEAGALEAKARGIASLQQLAGKDRDRVATAATSLLSSELNEDAQKRLAEYRAKLEAQYREPRGPTSLEQRVALYKSDPKLYKALFGDKESSKAPSPRDIIAAKQYAANLPLEQLDLSNDVKMAIKNKAKSLNDPTSAIYQEIQKARDRAAQNILFLDIPEADDLLKRQPR